MSGGTTNDAIFKKLLAIENRIKNLDSDLEGVFDNIILIGAHLKVEGFEQP